MQVHVFRFDLAILSGKGHILKEKVMGTQSPSCRNPGETREIAQNRPVTVIFNGKPHTLPGPLPSLDAFKREIIAAFGFEQD
jgi:hypothetical protein